MTLHKGLFVSRVRGDTLDSQRYVDNCFTKLINFVGDEHSGDAFCQTMPKLNNSKLTS